MFKLFGTKSIRGRVMEVIEAKIAESQVKYDEKCAELYDELQENIENLVAECDKRKEHEADMLVRSIIGKII